MLIDAASNEAKTKISGMGAKTKTTKHRHHHKTKSGSDLKPAGY